MAYTVTTRSTRDDGRPLADLRGPDDAFMRVIGAEAHGLVEGRMYAVQFTDVGEAPKPVPHTPTVPLVQVALGGTVTTPKE
jgi:hypothetical protein